MFLVGKSTFRRLLQVFCLRCRWFKFFWKNRLDLKHKRYSLVLQGPAVKNLMMLGLFPTTSFIDCQASVHMSCLFRERSRTAESYKHVASPNHGRYKHVAAKDFRQINRKQRERIFNPCSKWEKKTTQQPFLAGLCVFSKVKNIH